MSEYVARDLEAFVRERWSHLCRLHPALKTRGPLAVKPEFTDQEARGFFFGLDSGLFAIGGPGGVRFEYTALGGGPAKDLFEGSSTKRAFKREYVLQFATAASLNSYGWSPDEVQVEPILEPGEWALDIAIYENPGRIGKWVVGIECKTNMGEFDRLPDQIRQCGLSGEGDAEVCTKRRSTDTAHKNYRALLRERPRWYCTVAPGVQKAFRVNYVDPDIINLDFAHSGLVRRV